MFYQMGLFVAVVGPVVTFALPLADAYGLVKVCVALIGALILWASCARARFELAGFEVPLLAFGIAFFWAWVNSIDPIVGLLGVYGQPFYGLAAILPAVMIYYGVGARTEAWDGGAFKCAGAICAIGGLVAASQLYGWTGSWERFGLIGVRAQGTMGSPPYFGAVMAPCLPPVVWLAFRARGWRRWAWGAAAALGFLALTAAHSRGPIIGAAVGLWAFLAACGAIRPRLRHLGAAAGLLAILGALYAGRIDSDSGRLETWKIAAAAGAERPIAGWGPDTFALVNRRLKTRESVVIMGPTSIQASAHNLFLQAWATMGLPGLLAFVWLAAAALYWKWDDARCLAYCNADERAAAAFGSIVAFLIAGMTNPVPTMALYVVAAVMGGSSVWQNGTARVASRAAWALGLGAILATVPMVGAQMLAETLHSFGNHAIRNRDINLGADLLRQANEIAPWDSNYAAARCDLIERLATIFPQHRAAYTKRALVAAAGAVKAHPQDPGAFELMSSVELRATPSGRGHARAALRSAKRAAELDPLNEFSAIRWAQAAVLVEDKKELARANARFDLVRSLRK